MHVAGWSGGSAGAGVEHLVAVRSSSRPGDQHDRVTVEQWASDEGAEWFAEGGCARERFVDPRGFGRVIVGQRVD